MKRGPIPAAAAEPASGVKHRLAPTCWPRVDLAAAAAAAGEVVA